MNKQIKLTRIYYPCATKFDKIVRFVKAWFAIRSQRDPDKLALALGRPEKLVLTDEQAAYIEELFLEYDAPEVGKRFFRMFPRTYFRYFLVPTEDGQALTFGPIDYELDAIELIWAAAKHRGALVEKEDGDYWQLAHPMAKRYVEIGSKMTIPVPGGKGILGI